MELQASTWLISGGVRWVFAVDIEYFQILWLTARHI